MPHEDGKTPLITVDLKKIGRANGLDKEVGKVYKLLRRYKESSKRIAWVNRRKKAWDAIEGKILEEADIDEMRKNGQENPVQVNKCNKGVQGSAAIVTDQKPEIKFIPIGSGDLYVSELLKRANDVVWRKSEGSDVVYDLVEETKVGAIGFIDSKFDPSKGNFGQVRFEESNPLDYYFDDTSRARDFSDTHIIKAVPRTIEYIKDNYDGIKEADLCFNTDLGEANVSHGITSGDNYAIDIEDSPDGKGEGDVKCVWEIEAWMMHTVKLFATHKVDGGNVDVVFHKTREEAKEHKEQNESEIIPITRKARKQIIVVGNKPISKKINPNGVDSDGDPIISIIGLKGQRTRNAYPMSPTNYSRESNRHLIKKRMQFDHAIAHLVNSPYVLPDGSKWENGNAGTPGSCLKVPKNSAFVPHRMPPGAGMTSLIQSLEELDARDINDHYDLQDVMVGKLKDKIAWQTVYALQEQAGMMTKPFLRSLESALTRLGKNILALILRHWTRGQFRRLIEDKEWESWVPDEVKAEIESNPSNQQNQEVDEAGNVVGPPEVQPAAIRQKWKEALDLVAPESPTPQQKKLEIVDIDILVLAGSSLPTNRMAQLNVAMEMKERGVYDVEATLDYIDDPNKDQIVKRMNAREEAATQAAALQGLK